MTNSRTVLITSSLALALLCGAAQAQEVAPLPGDIKVNNTAQDRFYKTDLDKILKEKGIKTLIMVGWKISGSVTYTSVAAMAHDYTVVIPMDTTSAGSSYETTIGFYN